MTDTHSEPEVPLSAAAAEGQPPAVAAEEGAVCDAAGAADAVPAAAGAEGVSEVPDAGGDEVLRLELDQFEGPFEVLLYLIKEQEIDIFDIPIMQVTEQYLKFLDMMREENLDVAGEFLVMAATLIQIKSRMILPVELDSEDEEEVEEEDPRLELVGKLLEYRKFRDLSQGLGDRADRQADQFGRRVRPLFEPAEDEDDGFIEVSLYDLLKAVRAVLRFVSGDLFHKVTMEQSSVDEKIGHIETLLQTQESVSWTELWRGCRSRVELVCCLLAILELCRMRRIRAHQHVSFGEIRLFARDGGGDAGPEEAAPDVAVS